MQSRVKTQENTGSMSITRIVLRSTFALRVTAFSICVISCACGPQHRVTRSSDQGESSRAVAQESGASDAVAAHTDNAPARVPPSAACSLLQPHALAPDSSAPVSADFDAVFEATLAQFSNLLERTRWEMNTQETPATVADGILSEFVRHADPLAVLTDRGWRLSAQRLCRLGGAVVTSAQAELALPLLQQAVGEGRSDDPCLASCRAAVEGFMSLASE